MSRAPEPSTRRTLAVTVGVMVLAATASYALDDAYAGTAVAAIFIGATWWEVLRHSEEHVVRHGLSFGGLTLSGPLEPRRVARDLLGAFAWAVGAALLVFPPFYFGYLWWWQPQVGPQWALPNGFADMALAQVLVVALPEEMFFRGYVQSNLERSFEGSSRRIFGARLGMGWLISSGLFAVGHMLTVVHPSRLAVFFPSLLFGWLRQRCGGVGAAVLFHAMCNLLTLVLAESFGLR